mmetsp:Transcript_32098/g.72043  ORF Transcript_32098/g.72043 Transcript_32098/m.72043 type:complete len:102 (-) Transcript_32098:974-1279(-)
MIPTCSSKSKELLCPPSRGHIVFPITYIILCRNGIGSPHFPKNKTMEIFNARLRVSMKRGSWTLLSIFVAPKQYTGTTGTLCLQASLKIPFLVFRIAASSF